MQAVSRLIVPEVVMSPPQSPVPAQTEVTVPEPLETVPQHKALEPVLIRTWPAVPQEPAQSIIPAPGLRALVLLPVSQGVALSRPIHKQQSTLESGPAPNPIKILQQPVVVNPPVRDPRKVLLLPVVRLLPEA